MAKASENSPATAPRSKAMLVLVPAAVLLIGGAAVWKSRQTRAVSSSSAPKDLRASPSFALADQNSQMVRLESYLHRHHVVLVFFDGRKGPDANPWLKVLNKNHKSIEASGFVVFGVTTALPQQNRKANFELTLLSEVDPAKPVHTEWGALDESGETIPKMFYINRARQVQFEGQRPKAVDQPDALVNAIVEGRDPESVL